MKATSMQQRWEAQRARQRQWAGVVGVMIGAVVVSAVTVLFGTASQMPWLPPTPANLELMARCDQALGTAARQHCVEDTVARALAAGPDVRVAGSPASSLAQ